MLEYKLTVHPTKRTLRQILELRAKLRTLALGKTEKLLLYSRQWYYEGANKAHTFLPNMLMTLPKEPRIP